MNASSGPNGAEREPLDAGDDVATTVAAAWESIRLVRPAQLSQRVETQFFSSPEERERFYGQGLALFGDRFSPSILLAREMEFAEITLVRARLNPGDRVLVLGERLGKSGYLDLITARLGTDTLEYVEMTPQVVRPEEVVQLVEASDGRLVADGAVGSSVIVGA